MSKSDDLTKVEYRVREIKRFVVTRYHQSEHGAGVDTKGEYGNPEIAYEVGYALCKAEHERLGWPVADDRIQYPQMPVEAGGATPL
jgi:hypothetical protein